MLAAGAGVAAVVFGALGEWARMAAAIIVALLLFVFRGFSLRDYRGRGKYG